MVLCKLFLSKDLLGCKFSLYNPLEVEPKSLLKSLRIRIFHRRVIAVHIMAREAALLSAHLEEFIESKSSISKGRMSVPGPYSFEECGWNQRGTGWRESLALVAQDWQGRGLLWW